MEALVLGRSIGVAWALPHLLSRAGFQVDALVTSPLMRRSRFTRYVHVVDPGTSIAEAACYHVQARGKKYDWVIVTDDPTLAELAAHERHTGRPSGLLPLTESASRDHIFSKIGLSRALSAAGIRTPEFRVVGCCDDAISAAREIGYPVMVKVDASCAGMGERGCRDDASLLRQKHLFRQPLVIQKKIEGRELDLSPVFLDGELVHFNYSVINRTESPFGPSVVRTYLPCDLADGEVFAELTALGRALGANGFLNVSCIEAADGSGRYYIEADMRPNVWVDFSRFCGDDAASHIRDWVTHRVRLSKGNGAPAAPAAMTIPYFLRLSNFELMINRHAVWKFIPLADGKLVRRLLAIKVLYSVLALGKWLIPRAWRPTLRNRLDSAGAFLG